MKYFYDTEFYEDGQTIELISIGIVAEDGRTYYAVNHDAKFTQEEDIATIRSRWLVENVIPHLPLRGKIQSLGISTGCGWRHHLDTSNIDVKPAWVIRNEIHGFMEPADLDDRVELWADYGAYDHVVLMQLFGTMARKPAFLPMVTNDIQQLAAGRPMPETPCHLGIHGSDITYEMTSHYALTDAVETAYRWQYFTDPASLIVVDWPST